MSGHWEDEKEYYMNSEILQFYYKGIKNVDSPENDVDHFWGNLLPEYFEKKLGYGIEVDQSPLGELGIEERADWTIRVVRKVDSKKVVFVGNRRKDPKFKFTPAGWNIAVAHLTNYMMLLSTEDGQDTKRPLYGAVNIGHYTRFYELDIHNAESVDYPGTQGRIFELAGDEHDVHRTLLDMVQRTSH